MNDSHAQPETPSPAPPATMDCATESFAARHVVALVLIPFILASLCLLVIKHHDFQVGMTSVRINRAKTRGDAKAVIAGWEKLIRLSRQDDWRLHVSLGEAYMDAGDYAKALPQFEKAQQLNKECYVERQLMTCDYELGRLDEGRARLGAVLKKYPVLPEGNYYWATDLMREGKYAEAAKALRATSSSPKWNARAEVLRKEMTKKVFEQGVPVTPPRRAVVPLIAPAPATHGTTPDAGGSDGASSASRALGRAVANPTTASPPPAALQRPTSAAR